MKTIDNVIRDVVKRTGIDEDIVAAVCKHPFQVVVSVMKDETDNRDILFNTLLKFKLKRRYKENKTAKYSSK